jgi:hypothetical protein
VGLNYKNMCPIEIVILNEPLLFLFVNLAVSTKLALPLAKVPLCIVLTVKVGITLCVNNLPATLNLKPDKLEGIIEYL